MSLRRSSCRIRSWLVRDGNVKTGPPRLSLPPGERTGVRRKHIKSADSTLNRLYFENASPILYSRAVPE